MISATSNHPWNETVRVEVRDGRVWWFDGKQPISAPRDAKEMVKHIDRVFKFTVDMEPDGGTEEELIALLYSRPLEFDIQLVYISICGCNMGHCGTVLDVSLYSQKVVTYGDVLQMVSLDFMRHLYYKDVDAYCACAHGQKVIQKATFRTCESLVKALEKYNLAVDPAQVAKHMYSNAVDKRLHPHWYDYMDSNVLRMQVVVELPDVYRSCREKNATQPKVILRQDTTYVSVKWSR